MKNYLAAMCLLVHFATSCSSDVSKKDVSKVEDVCEYYDVLTQIYKRRLELINEGDEMIKGGTPEDSEDIKNLVSEIQTLQAKVDEVGDAFDENWKKSGKSKETFKVERDNCKEYKEYQEASKAFFSRAN